MNNQVTSELAARAGTGDETRGRRPTIDIVQASLKRRYRSERRFRIIGLGAVFLGLTFVAILFADIIGKGYSAFQQTYLRLAVDFSAEVIDPEGTRDPTTLGDANYLRVARDALSARFPEVTSRSDRQALFSLLSAGVPQELRERVLANPAIVGTTQEVWVLANDDIDSFMKGRSTAIDRQRGEGTARPSLIPAGAENEIQVRSTEADFAGIPPGIPLDGNMPSYLVAINGGLIKVTAVNGNTLLGQVLRPLTHLMLAPPGSWETMRLATPEHDRRLKDPLIASIHDLQSDGAIAKRFNTPFFTHGDSREPELAGIAGALMGSFYTLILTLALSFPIGVGAAIYLEEFAPKNWLTDLIEININNLAAVPSIIFGLLGLAVFINFFGIPRSTPLVGAVVLTFMTLPTIIIASRSALRSVPPSIREAALGVGASPLQTQFHHVLPLAVPGMLTGAILGMARALGETAPLLMIGMIAFIVDIPSGFLSPSTLLPVQIYLWADSPEVGFVERTSAAILVLLTFLALMNLAAVLLRRKFERRW